MDKKVSLNVEQYLEDLIKRVKQNRVKHMNRIRYTKNATGKRLESVKTFNHPTNGARYRVVLDTEAESWYVLDAEGGTVASTGQATSLHKLKKDAKTALEKLGIEFAKEARLAATDITNVVPIGKNSLSCDMDDPNEGCN